MKTKGIIENNEILLENNSTLLFPADYYDLINPNHFNLGDYFDISIVSNMVIKIEQNDRELPKKNANAFFLFVSEDRKKLFDKFSENRNKDITIPSNYNFDGYNLELPFLVIYEKKTLKNISQNGETVKPYNPNEIKYKDELCWIENNNLVSRFGKITLPKGFSEKDEKGNFKYDTYKLIENKTADSLLSIDLNYTGNLPNDNKDAWNQVELLSTRIPNDSRVIAKKVDDKAKNFSLLYNKNAKIEETNGFRGSLIKYNNWKNFGLKSADFKAIADKEKQNAIHLLGENNVKCLPNVSFNWRLAIGLGNESVYETSITLHHIYGFPYIPASAIKGVLRNYIINTSFELTDDERKKYEEKDWSKEKEKKACANSDFLKIFGSTDQQGKAIFFDAFPIEIPTIMTDVMTPHYGDYYKGIAPPADWQSPNPILFLTVEGTKFQFIVGIKKGEESFNIEIGKYKGNVLDQVVLILTNALKEHGIGAKTAVGYGYMNNK